MRSPSTKLWVCFILSLGVVVMMATTRSFAQPAPIDSTPPVATANANPSQQTAPVQEAAVNTSEPALIDTLTASAEPAATDTLTLEPTPAETIVPEPTTYSGPVTGVVRSDAGEPLIGAMVVVKGTTRGSPTDFMGGYSITAQTSNTLEVSYPGYQPKEVQVGVDSQIDVVLDQDVKVIDNVVVTALGIKRDEKALSYTVQTVSSDELTAAKGANFVGSLAGKVAGVQIQASGGPGGGMKVVSRGMKSLQGNNNVLYVVDGVPLRNSQSKSEGNFETITSSEGIADINPDDIESFSMLTGPAAAALYGYEGANGVILITTKKGSGEKTSVTLSNATTFSNPLMFPKFQFEFGSDGSTLESWGSRKKVTYNPLDFFQTGFNATTSVSVQTGVGKHQVYFSAANTAAQGILPNNDYNRYNFSFRYTSSFFKDKLTLDASANYIKQNDKNLVSQGWYNNPLPALYTYPRDNDFASLKDYRQYVEALHFNGQKWDYGALFDSQNPYWTMNNMNRENKKDRYMLSTSLRYDITSWLNISARANIDNSISQSTRKYEAGTSSIQAGTKGRYYLNKRNEQQIYADVLANFNKTFGDWNIFVNVGGSIKDYQDNSNTFEGDLTQGVVANLFTVQNARSSVLQDFEDDYHHQVQSVFANAEVGYKGMVYLTLTGRNDWDSSLAYGSNDISFFYPSVGLSLVFNQMFKMPKGFDFAKLRFSRTEVGSGLPERNTSFPKNNLYYVPSTAGVFKPTEILPYNFVKDPENELTVSYEVGADLRFWGGALTFDATWYLMNTFNQTFVIPITPTGTGQTAMRIQAGNVQNMGVELALGFNKHWNKTGISWNSGLTYSYNKNTIKELFNPEKYKDPETGNPLTYNDRTPFAQFGGGNSPIIRLVEGGSMNDLYVQRGRWRRSGGFLDVTNDELVYEQVKGTDGLPLYDNLGSMSPHSHVAWNNSLSYGNPNIGSFNLGVQIRGSFGGWVVSNTQAYLDRHGVSEYSAQIRNTGITVDGQKITKPKTIRSYIMAITDGGGVNDFYVYKATNIRLGELSLSYTMPRKWFNDVVGITVGFVATNVAMLYCEAPFDPGQTAGAGNNYYNGVDNFMIPSTRNFGFNVKLQF